MRAKACFLRYPLLNIEWQGRYTRETLAGIRIGNTDTILIQHKGIASCTIIP
jgi:hypothetical protein